MSEVEFLPTEPQDDQDDWLQTCAYLDRQMRIWWGPDEEGHMLDNVA